MDFMTFWGLTILILILVPMGGIFLSYWIPKSLGYKRVGTVISLTLIAGLALLVLFIVFHDRLFFKSDVDKFLAGQSIKLNDDFRILSNKDDGLIGAYQAFEVEISHGDKKQIIGLIKNSNNFGLNSSDIPEPNSTVSFNYEDDSYFTRKTTRTFGQGYSPVIEIVNVHKEKNRLICYKYLP
jgi:hypothetical protein